jgi:hypothetical protein
VSNEQDTPDEEPETATPPESAKVVRKGKVDPATVGEQVAKSKAAPAPRKPEPPDDPPAPGVPSESFTDGMMKAFPLFSSYQ